MAISCSLNFSNLRIRTGITGRFLWYNHCRQISFANGSDNLSYLPTESKVVSTNHRNKAPQHLLKFEIVDHISLVPMEKMSVISLQPLKGGQTDSREYFTFSFTPYKFYCYTISIIWDYNPRTNDYTLMPKCKVKTQT